MKEESKRKRPNSWPDNSIPIRQTHSHGSFVSRTKRQTKGNDGAEITKRSSEIQFAPALQYFYGYPQSINSYQGKYSYYIVYILITNDRCKCMYILLFPQALTIKVVLTELRVYWRFLYSSCINKLFYRFPIPVTYRKIKFIERKIEA